MKQKVKYPLISCGKNKQKITFKIVFIAIFLKIMISSEIHFESPKQVTATHCLQPITLTAKFQSHNKLTRPTTSNQKATSNDAPSNHAKIMQFFLLWPAHQQALHFTCLVTRHHCKIRSINAFTSLTFTSPSPFTSPMGL